MMRIDIKLINIYQKITLITHNFTPLDAALIHPKVIPSQKLKMSIIRESGNIRIVPLEAISLILIERINLTFQNHE